MPGLYSTPYPPEGEVVTWKAGEVLIDLFGKPHLMLRVTIRGPHFPHRALEPVVYVGETRSRMVRISDDGLRADAYFDKEPANNGMIWFGHGDTVELVVPDRFASQAVERLDRGRLPEGVRLMDEEPPLRPLLDTDGTLRGPQEMGST